MSRVPERPNDSDAKEITRYLLDKGIPQNTIKDVVKRSQSWVSNEKKAYDLANEAREEGYQQARTEIIENLEDKTAKEISKKILNEPESSNYKIPFK